MISHTFLESTVSNKESLFSNYKAVDRKVLITYFFKKNLEVTIKPLQRYLSSDESSERERETILLELFFMLFTDLLGNSIVFSIKWSSIISEFFLLCNFSLS